MGIKLSTAPNAAADNATAPAQTQREDGNKKSDDVNEKKKKQEDAYKQICIEDVWLRVHETVDSNPPSLEQQTQRTGWHTVRVFVSSTFRDFHSERDVLVKKV